MRIVKDFDLDDIFLFSEIMDKMDLNIESEKLARKIQATKLENKDDAKAIGKEVVVAMGGDFILQLVRNMYKAQAQLKRFIANMTGMTPEEVSKMNLNKIKEFFKLLVESEGFDDFLEQAGESVASKAE